jgi:hypothetical protein
MYRAMSRSLVQAHARMLLPAIRKLATYVTTPIVETVYSVEVDVPECFSTFRNLPHVVHSLQSHNFLSFVLLYIVHVIPDQRHHSS